LQLAQPLVPYILGGADVALETMLGDIAFLSGRKAA
jgi:hypothetical protein